MYLTWLDSNSWLIEVEGVRILLDPWLVGDLVFGNLTWLFRGEKTKQKPLPEDIDLILLSQGLEDHAHPATLKELDHKIAVVGSPNAAKVVQELGYSQVTALKHGESQKIKDLVEITAMPGSPIGPQLVENGYLIKNLQTGETLYYEPHGYHSASLKEKLPIDIVVTPIINLKLPLVGAVIKGQESALEVCQWLQPKVIIPTAAGGDINFSGLLLSFLSAQGDAATFSKLLLENQLTTQVIDPKPGERFLVNTATI